MQRRHPRGLRSLSPSTAASALAAGVLGFVLFGFVAVHATQQPGVAAAPLSDERPAQFTPVTGAFDHVRRDVMIAMRDGVRLHTVILVPKGAKRAPILLTRTPYDATRLTTHAESGRLVSVLTGYDNPTDVVVEGGYIRVVQDVRGKYGSEGDYVMTRPLRGPLNPTPVDHSTDTYDTIDWLVKNVPESNGRVGILGISYDGFLPLMALVNPHPALKVAVPMNPMVDGWRGDDWFHNGAFRQQMMPYIYDQEATRDNTLKWWSNQADDYDMYMEAGLGRRTGPIARPRADRLLAQDPRAPGVRRVLEPAGDGQDPRRAAAAGADDAGARAVGPGGHLRRAGGLPGDRAEGHGERQGLLRRRAVVPRTADRRRQRARRASASTATPRRRSVATCSGRSSRST